MTLQDPVEEAARLLDLADRRGLTVRAVGGVAIWMRCPSLRSAQPPRVFHDIDLAASRRDTKDVSALFEEDGYEPHRRFNTLAGTRLIFTDPQRDRRVDVFLDVMEMCHTLDLGDALAVDRRTVPLADLLLSKLQVVRPTDRDIVDLAALLADHPLGNETAPNEDRIDTDRILKVCNRDWGWWRTVTSNLRVLEELWADGEAVPGPDRSVAIQRARELREVLEASPKSARWKARAVLGERLSWHRDPEEVQG